MSEVMPEDLVMPDWSQVDNPTQDRTDEEVESDGAEY